MAALNKLVEQNEFVRFTTDVNEAMYIDFNLNMISSHVDGYRVEDHRIIEQLTDLNRYDNHFWSYTLFDFSLVLIIPEEKSFIAVEDFQPKHIIEFLESNGFVRVEL